MNLIIVSVAVLFIIAAIVVAVIQPRTGMPLPTPVETPRVYYARESLFTPAERSFLGVLETLDYDDITIAPKVRLADILGINRRTPWKDRQRALNRITSKHVDFLLIARRDGRPLLGLELDDSSHEEDDRVARDDFVDAAFATAGLPLLHIPVRSTYDLKAIDRQISAALERSPAPEPANA